MIKKSDQEWCEILTPTQYKVCRQKGTEPAFSGELLHEDQNGTFVCVCCNAKLFRSEAKFDSGSGWPSFWQPIESNIAEKMDKSNNMIRTEVTCKNCDAHLGHVFDDGPKPSNLRYCINSVSLKFVPD